MAWRETQQRAYPSARTVSAVRSTGFARRIAGGRPEESRVLAKPRSAADVQQRVRGEAVGGAFDQLLFDQAVAPGSWDCACSVVCTRERSARRGDNVAVPTEVRGDEHRIAKIPAVGEAVQGRSERGRRGARRLDAGWIRVRCSTEAVPARSRIAALGSPRSAASSATASARQAPRTAGAWQVVRAASAACSTAARHSAIAVSSLQPPRVPVAPSSSRIRSARGSRESTARVGRVRCAARAG